MKIQLNQDVLQEVNSKIAGFIKGKASMPILSGVLVLAQEDLIVFTASNGSDSVIHRVFVDNAEGNKVIEQGSCMFSKEVFEVVRKMKKKPISFELEGTNLTVNQDKTKLSFATMDASHYPNIEVPQNQKPLVFSGPEFNDFVTQTSFATAKTETRPILMGVNICMKQDTCLFVGTDSHRLARYELKDIKGIENYEDLKITVPASLLEQATKSFDISSTSSVLMIIGTTSIALVNQNTILLTTLLEGNYPETERLIPTEFAIESVVNREEIIQTLELLQLIAADRKIVNLKANDMFWEFSVAETGAKGVREVAYESYEGQQDFSISFSIHYSLDVLRRLESDSVRLCFKSDNTPFLVLPVVEDTSKTCITQLILPVRQM